MRYSGSIQRTPFEPLERRIARWENLALLVLSSTIILLLVTDLLAASLMALWSTAVVLWLSSKPHLKGTGSIKALRYLLPLTALVFLFNLLLYPPSGKTIITLDLYPLTTFPITVAALCGAIRNSLKLLSITLLFWFLTFTPDSDALFFTLKRHSTALPLMTLSSFYLLPRVRGDAENILEVQRVRGVVTDKGFMGTLRSRSMLVIPLLRDSFIRGDILVESLEARGLAKLKVPPLKRKRSTRRLLALAAAGTSIVLALPLLLRVLPTETVPWLIPGVAQGVAFTFYTSYFIRGVWR